MNEASSTMTSCLRCRVLACGKFHAFLASAMEALLGGGDGAAFAVKFFRAFPGRTSFPRSSWHSSLPSSRRPASRRSPPAVLGSAVELLRQCVEVIEALLCGGDGAAYRETATFLCITYIHCNRLVRGALRNDEKTARLQ